MMIKSYGGSMKKEKAYVDKRRKDILAKLVEKSEAKRS